MTTATILETASGSLSAVSLPFYQSPAACGFPSPAADYAEDSLSLDKKLIEHPAATFFARASGHSMTGIGIMDGAILVIDRSRTPRDRDIIIALLDGDLLVKRYRKKGQTVMLQSENARYAPIELSEGQTLEVWGVVTASINQY